MLTPNIKKIASTMALVVTINTPTMGALWLMNNNLMAGIESNKAELVILRKGQNELLVEVRTLTTKVTYTEKHLTRLDDMHRGAVAHGYHPETPE